MANGSGKIVTNFQGETSYIILVPHKTTSPLADVVCIIDGIPLQTRKVYPPGTFGGDPVSMLVEGLDLVWYAFFAYRSADGVALDEQINVIAFNAADGAQGTVTKYEYLVDRGNSEPGVWADPVSGDRGILDTRLNNEVYWVEERMTGVLSSTEIEDRGDTGTNEGGGWQFTDVERTMNEGTWYFVFVCHTSAVASGGDSTVIVGSSGVVYLSNPAGDTFDPVTMNNKILIANYSGVVGKLTFPSLATLPNCKFKINTHFGSQRYFQIQLSPGETMGVIKVAANLVNYGQGEADEIEIINNLMFVANGPLRYARLGECFFADRKNILNTHLLDGTPGIEAEWPGVTEILDNLPANGVVDFATWNADVIVSSVNYGKQNKLKWARDGAGNFKFPLRLGYFVRALSLDSGDPFRVTQGPGGFQAQDVMPHYHNVGTESNPSTSPPEDDFQQDDAVGGGHTSRYWNTGNTNATGRKDTTGNNKGFETRPANFQQYYSVYI